jgi:hypothetical protein
MKRPKSAYFIDGINVVYLHKLLTKQEQTDGDYFR